MPSTWSNAVDAWDLTFKDPVSENDDLGVMLIRSGRREKVADWAGTHQSSLASEPFRRQPVSITWKNGGIGAGHSIRLPETTASTHGGAITSLAYSYAPWTTSIVPGLMMPSGELTTLTLPDKISTGSIVDGIDYNGNFYFTTGGRYLIKIPGGTGSVVPIDLTPPFTSINLATFKGYLYIAGQGSGVIRRYDGSSVANGNAGTERGRLATVYWTISPQLATGGAANTGGTGAFRLIGTNASGTQFYHVADTADPLLSADWSAATKIGDGATYTTQWIVGDAHTVWFATTGGVYACDETGYSPNITQWMMLAFHPSNGGQVVYWNGLIWYAHESGLVAVPTSGERQDKAERWSQFGYLTPNQSPMFGRPRAIAPGTDGLWIGYYNPHTNTSYIMRLYLDKDGIPHWSGPEAVISGETVTCIRQVSPHTSRPWLAIATQVTGGTSPPKLYRQDLPVSGNPYVDWSNGTGHRFSTNSQIYLPKEDAESVSRKVPEQYTVVVKNVEYPSGVAIYANPDETGYVLQGSTNKAGRSIIPAPNDSDVGVSWEWRIDCSGTATQPWILETFGASMAIIPDAQRLRTYHISIAERQMLRNGNEMIQDPGYIWAKLEGWQHRKRLLMRDQWRRVSMVRIEEAIQHGVTWDSKQECWVLEASLVVRFLRQPARFSNGYVFNGGATFSAAGVES